MQPLSSLVVFLVIGLGANLCGVSGNFVPYQQQTNRPNRNGSDVDIQSKCKVDFRNFNYPGSLSSPDSFQLKDGVFPRTETRIGYHFLSESYADVVGDQRKEAIVTLGIDTGGSASPTVIYVFEMDTLKLLWRFVSGDRADGGLRNVYGDGRDLVIESYEPDSEIGASCSKSFTRTIYKWENKEFVRRTVETNIAIPKSGSSFIGKSSSCPPLTVSETGAP